MDSIISIIAAIQPSQSAFINLIIQCLVLEISLFISVPLIGIIINAVVANGIRKAVSRVLGQRAGYFFTNYLLFAGVVIHELSHAFFALITGARIDEIALFSPEGDTLGHVEFSPRGGSFARALQLSLSACAPVVMGLVFTFLIAARIFPVINKTWQWVLFIYLFISILSHMNMSSADLKCYFRGAIPTLAIGIIVCLAVLLTW